MSTPNMMLCAWDCILILFVASLYFHGQKASHAVYAPNQPMLSDDAVIAMAEVIALP
jgi:hypothetical protein